MYRFLFSRRWIGLTLVLAAAIVVMVQLGRWQWHRFEHRTARNAATSRALQATGVPVTSLLHLQGPVGRALVWRTATASGHYDQRRELLVRRRSLGGNIGFYVLTPLVPAAGPAVLVNRGWVPSASSALATPLVPAAASGNVTVTGRVRAGEPATDQTGYPAGQVARIAPWKIARTLPYPVLDGYLELTAQQPQAGQLPRLLPPPELSSGPHLAYAVQWFLFAGVAVVGWGVLARQEAHDPGGRARRAAAAPVDQGRGSG